MEYNILIADHSHISKLVDIGIESFTETCEIEIKKRIDKDFYYICTFEDKIIAKCLIKKCCLTEDDDDSTYYLREVYKNKDHTQFKMIKLLQFGISHISLCNPTIKLFVDIFNDKAIQLYKNLNFEIISYKSDLKYTNEYYNDKTYYKPHNKDTIKISEQNKLIRPDRNIPFYKMILKTTY